MMHNTSWSHRQELSDDHQCNTPYMNNLHNNHQQQHITEEESEQTGDEMHDTITPATSGEHSPTNSIFRLEFAATQWCKLVSNAESLFNKLMTIDALPHTEQDQIKQWLCMKQEYEECIANDDTGSSQGYIENAKKSLEKMEVTETDEKTGGCVHRKERRIKFNCSSSSESELYETYDDDYDEEEEEEEEEENSDDSSDSSNFLERLDECMKKFRMEMDKIVDFKGQKLEGMNMEIISAVKSVKTNSSYDSAGRPVAYKNVKFRRNSMLPDSEMCNDAIAFKEKYRCKRNQTFHPEPSTSSAPELFINEDIAIRNDNSQDLLIYALKATKVPEPIKELKNLTLNNEAKQTRVKKIQSDLHGAYRRIEELQATIKIKERFIADMIKNSDARSSAKQKFQHKWSKLEEEYCNTRSQLAQAENACISKDSEEKSAHKKEIELYKNMAIHYEKRLMDIEMIKQIADDSAKKVLELESSLNTSKKQMEKLKKQLNKEEQRKKQLEEELAEDQKRIRDLEEKYNLTASKLKEMQSESEDERSNSRLKADYFDKKKNLFDVSARISHLDHVLKEKSMDLERTADIDVKEALRHEIRNLRRTRDCLVDEKCDLDEKFQKKKTLSTVEERKLLECGETIEAIDAMIEHKNEMICGRKEFDENQSQRKQGERMLMERLAKLSDGEMRTLFYKYFLKVIDLKESSKNLEIQTTELESHIENQEWRMQTLSNALKQNKLETERRLILMQREHEQKMHLMFRHFADETGSSGHEKLDKESELSKYKRENKTLRKRLADVEALLKGPTPRCTDSPAKISQQGLKQIAPSNRPTTKVTRQRNKLIIQKTTDCDKKKK